METWLLHTDRQGAGTLHTVRQGGSYRQTDKEAGIFHTVRHKGSNYIQCNNEPDVANPGRNSLGTVNLHCLGPRMLTGVMREWRHVNCKHARVERHSEIVHTLSSLKIGSEKDLTFPWASWLFPWDWCIVFWHDLTSVKQYMFTWDLAYSLQLSFAVCLLWKGLWNN